MTLPNVPVPPTFPVWLTNAGVDVFVADAYSYLGAVANGAMPYSPIVPVVPVVSDLPKKDLRRETPRSTAQRII